MDLQSIITKIAPLASAAAEQAQTVINNEQISDPEKMLQMQFAMQQYSNFINYGSSFIKTIRDLVTGIVAKI